jgi:hypothetical protein
MPAYDSLEAAVYYAADAARAIYGNKREAISIVYEQDGRFHFTPPVSEQEAHGPHRAKAAIPIPKGSARYIVHNHPSGDRDHLFSENDIAMAHELRVPSAIIFGRETPTIRVFQPDSTSVTRVRRARASLGDAFNWKPPAAGQGNP